MELFGGLKAHDSGTCVCRVGGKANLLPDFDRVEQSGIFDAVNHGHGGHAIALCRMGQRDFASSLVNFFDQTLFQSGGRAGWRHGGAAMLAVVHLGQAVGRKTGAKQRKEQNGIKRTRHGLKLS